MFPLYFPRQFIYLRNAWNCCPQYFNKNISIPYIIPAPLIDLSKGTMRYYVDKQFQNDFVLVWNRRRNAAWGVRIVKKLFTKNRILIDDWIIDPYLLLHPSHDAGQCRNGCLASKHGRPMFNCWFTCRYCPLLRFMTAINLGPVCYFEFSIIATEFVRNWGGRTFSMYTHSCD